MHLSKKQLLAFRIQGRASTRDSLVSPVVTEAASQSAGAFPVPKWERERWLFAFKYVMSITLNATEFCTAASEGYMAMCQERQSPSQSCLPTIHHPAAKAAGALRISETDNILVSHVP
jgi:hypothetical protein